MHRTKQNPFKLIASYRRVLWENNETWGEAYSQVLLFWSLSLSSSFSFSLRVWSALTDCCVESDITEVIQALSEPQSFSEICFSFIALTFISFSLPVCGCVTWPITHCIISVLPGAPSLNEHICDHYDSNYRLFMTHLLAHESDAIDLCNYNSKSMCQVSLEQMTSEVQKSIYILHLRRLIKSSIYYYYYC